MTILTISDGQPGTFVAIEKKSQGSKFISGDTITFVDFMLWEFLDHLKHFDSSLFDDSRVLNLKTFQTRIENLPKVADYLQEWIILEFELIYAH